MCILIDENIALNAKHSTWSIKILIGGMAWISICKIPVKRKDFEKILEISDMKKMLLWKVQEEYHAFALK